VLIDFNQESPFSLQKKKLFNFFFWKFFLIRVIKRELINAKKKEELKFVLEGSFYFFKGVFKSEKNKKKEFYFLNKKFSATKVRSFFNIKQ